MADKLGQNFMGTISGVTQWGFYVELDETKCEGLVSMQELADDSYEFDETNYRIVGRYHGKIYQLGEKVEIKVAKANFVSRQLDFALAESEMPTTEKKGIIRANREKGFKTKESKVSKFKSKRNQERSRKSKR